MSTIGAGGFYHAEANALLNDDGGLVHVTVITVRDDAWVPLAHRLTAALSHITHANVETLLRTDYPGQRNGGFCFVIDRADGGDLRAFLASNPAADVLAIARKIAGAVGHLHTSAPCIIHGNLDLASVLMHGDTPRLWDLGFCRFDPAPDTGPLVDLAPTPGERQGMLTAIAPELCHLGPVTTASDVYAFGILLFELFAQHGPFPSSSRLAAVALLCMGQRPSRDEIPLSPRGDAVWTIIRQCWAQDPAERPNMTQIEAALHLVP